MQTKIGYYEKVFILTAGANSGIQNGLPTRLVGVMYPKYYRLKFSFEIVKNKVFYDISELLMIYKGKIKTNSIVILAGIRLKL